MAEFNPLTHLPPVRRIVTGHDSNGKAVFHRDDLLTPVSASPALPSAGFTLIHRTQNYPVSVQGSDSELEMENLRRAKGPAGIVCEIVDVPPDQGSSPPHLHRNRSLDYGVVLDGALTLILDDGAEETIHKGDVFVQRGTMHGWKNKNNKYCRFLTVIIPSQEVVVESTGKALDDTKLPGLTD